MRKTIADVLKEEGRREGREEARQEARLKGRLEGELTARRAILLRQLRRRFGDLPGDVVRTVENAADVEQLDTWLGQLVVAASLDEVGIGHATSTNHDGDV